MSNTQQVLEYKCPCCNAGLIFGEDVQQLKCAYCENVFELDAVIAYNESELQNQSDMFTWESTPAQEWSEQEHAALRVFQCPSCGGELLTDDTTAATFCPFCDNPAIVPSRMHGAFKPDALIPFQKSKEEAKTAFLELCKGKPLLPKDFTKEHRLEKITGMYVPFWLYECDADFHGSYKATRVRTWSDSQYYYTKTDHYLLHRSAEASFAGIPIDASAKMNDTFMESIEPYDYTGLEDFNLAYLSGYFADKYDVDSETGEPRIKERVGQTIRTELQSSLLGYATVIPTSQQLNVHHGAAKYVLLPVWMLNTNYHGKQYSFAMNGQTGKMTGTLPICPKRTAAWFAGIFSVVTLLASIAQMVL